MLMSESVPNENDQVAELFREVLEMDRSDRLALYEQRDTPVAVRQEVESLLGEQALDMFSENALGSALRDLPGAAPGVAWEKGSQVGDYEIVGEVARGGMGVVYEAKQTSLGRRVAIKVVRGADFSEDEATRFRAEAEAIARLEHTGIVPVYEVVEHEGLHFYSMPYLSGGSLKDMDLPLDSRRAAAIVADICDAIHYAHTQNIVHRDLKPANVLLTETLQPKVSDFGLAKDIGDDSEGHTRTGAILGTPGFMAPEQARGDGEAVGHLADVYGLGGILFYLVTNRVPVEGKNLVDTLHNIVHQGAPDLRRVRPELEADLASICRKALEQDPMARYSSAAALAADLRRFVDGVPTEARPLHASQRFVRWCRRRPALAALAAIAIFSLIAGGTMAAIYAVEANRKASELAQANTDLKRSNRELTEARADAEAFSEFLLSDVVRSGRELENGGLGTDTSVREALLAAVPNIGKRFAGRPLAEAAARNEVGVTLRHVGEYKVALGELRKALEIRRRELGPEAEATLRTWNSLGAALWAANRFVPASKEFEQLLEIVDRKQHFLVAQVLRNLASCYQKRRLYGKQIPLLQRVVDMTEDVPRARAYSKLAIAQVLGKRHDDARKSLASVAEILRRQKVVGVHDIENIERNMFECFVMLRDDEKMVAVASRLFTRNVEHFGIDAAPTLYMARRFAALPVQRITPRLALLGIELLLQTGGQRDTLPNRKLLQRAAKLHLEAGDLTLAHKRALRAFESWAGDNANSPQAFSSEATLCQCLVKLGRAKEARDRVRLRIETLRDLTAKTEGLPAKQRWRHQSYAGSLKVFEALLESR